MVFLSSNDIVFARITLFISMLSFVLLLLLLLSLLALSSLLPKRFFGAAVLLVWLRSFSAATKISSSVSLFVRLMLLILLMFMLFRLLILCLNVFFSPLVNFAKESAYQVSGHEKERRGTQGWGEG